ncbi:putative short-subunit dehydrogenase-like oxidoreductase (DUF2520 family) [Anaerobacterium chartisolvens]|uniref:Putative short-subunit dehydrogenase-like oxidoreductase (DUF2520 family) n=1 Tax=Anaerobacterium chartisolvens TaxID=1297424 RepID=A0A369AMT4_9FIRM|nr:Rossmann-like and DUF2520 domain-containing protein [Anaerobacterium chartisolvens]RCX10375.1 putative short-subunit dehydrogenase-like oxidoreductase (DUF2520 family) [Anaerobacterium chartisolvens]
MRIGIIGAGRLGTALAVAMSREGHVPAAVYSKRHASSELLCERLGIGCVNSLLYAVASSDTIFIAVPDSQIEDVVQNIIDCTEDSDIRGRVFFHCSGAADSSVLEPLRLKGGHTASLHPLQTFADRENGWKGLYNIYFGYEGDINAQGAAGEVVNALKGSMIHIGRDDKALYHAAACILSNYTVALSWAAGEIFNKIGIDSATGVKALMPLLEKTVKNIEDLGSMAALTGPVSRGDWGTVQRHIDAMQKSLPDISRIYRVLGELTLDMAVKRGDISPEASRIMRGLLSDKTKGCMRCSDVEEKDGF